MEIVNKKLNLEGFSTYLSEKSFSLKPNEIVLHHTWRPTAEQWQGQKSINGMKAFYERKGWAAGPHIYIYEDEIWLFTDISKVGVHAGSANATWRKGDKVVTGYGPYAGYTLESYSIGIEVVGNYESQLWDEKTKETVLAVINNLQEALKIQKIAFHRDYQIKASGCPGWAITHEWVERELLLFKRKKMFDIQNAIDTWEDAAEAVEWGEKNKIFSSRESFNEDTFRSFLMSYRMQKIAAKDLLQQLINKL